MKKLAIFTTVLAVIAVLTTHPIQATEPVIPPPNQEDLIDEQVPLALPELSDLPDNSIAGVPWDLTALDMWCGRPEGSIRVIGGVKVEPNTIMTDDGHTWEFENVEIEYDQLYLVWFDDMGTNEVTDDQIIKLWKEVNF